MGGSAYLLDGCTGWSPARFLLVSWPLSPVQIVPVPQEESNYQIPSQIPLPPRTSSIEAFQHRMLIRRIVLSMGMGMLAGPRIAY
jgi:hypothetical protein